MQISMVWNSQDKEKYSVLDLQYRGQRNGECTYVPRWLHRADSTVQPTIYDITKYEPGEKICLMQYRLVQNEIIGDLSSVPQPTAEPHMDTERTNKRDAPTYILWRTVFLPIGFLRSHCHSLFVQL